MVDKEGLSAGRSGPSYALGAGVHREGDELDGALRPPDLDPVEGIIDFGEGVYLEDGAAPAVEILEVHVWQYNKKKAFRGRRLDPGRPDGARSRASTS
jgi:hypothetical protein